MALIPTLVRDTTITENKVVLYNETVYNEHEEPTDYAAYLVLYRKALDKPVEVFVHQTPNAIIWNVDLEEDGHYEARLILVPTYQHVIEDATTDTLSVVTVFYYEGKLYKPRTTLDFKLTGSPSAAPDQYIEVSPTYDILKPYTGDTHPNQKSYISEPFNFLWYTNLALKYAHFMREAYKECGGCDAEFTKKAVELRTVVLKLSTAESLKDYRGGQMILESEEQLIKSCSC